MRSTKAVAWRDGCERRDEPVTAEYTSMNPFTFFMPTTVYVGRDSLAELTRFQSRFRTPAIVCGAQSARASGALDAVRASFPGAPVFDGFPENPETTVCEAYAASVRKAGIDGIIALGGGSVLDGAKAIALLAPNDGCCIDYFDTPPAHSPLPLIAIPTTAGTGSEVTPYAVLVDPEARKKKTLKHPGLFPIAALLDPALTVSLPPAVTIATALDALSQGMEGYVSRRATPPGDLMALQVCRLVRQALPAALHNPGDLDARASLLYAAMLSGIVIAHTGTTIVHGMGYYYTLEHGIPHGAANGLLLPPVFQWNAIHAPEKVAQLAGALGRPCAPEIRPAADAVATALYEFYELIGFPRAARDHGVPEAASVAFAADIITDPYRFKNQIGELTLEPVTALFRAAWAGDVAPFWSDLSQVKA